MGNSSTKESRGSSSAPQQDPHDVRLLAPASTSRIQSGLPSDRFNVSQQNRSRNGRHDVSFLSIGNEQTPSLSRRETKQEREARKLEKERVARARERERSLKEEGVDGGYLVTLGTYVGPEDFSKPVVRQLMIERRLAPFWRGLNDHSESWTEHQLVAAAQGKPVPAPDEIPIEEQADAGKPQESLIKQVGLSRNQPSEESGHRISSFSQSYPTNSNLENASPLFRGRSKTSASLTPIRMDASSEHTTREVQLPRNPYLNGQRVEANLYKDVLECPICFLYYPPFLNRTRCCDQPICSECFVQIKRPDPHPPEHTDPNSAIPSGSQPSMGEAQLVSEPASCPFCVQPELGITYEPPPFRRGLIYQGQNAPPDRQANIEASGSSLAKVVIETPDTTPNPSMGRRRGQSLSSSDPAVISTDRVRPDWFKKLSDARAHATRRSAAATALHSAAYMMGGHERMGLGRRRRITLRDNSGSPGEESNRLGDSMNIPNVEALLAALEGQGSSANHARGNSETSSSRLNSRISRVEDLEEVMMMEAIRQSLAAEEERKKRLEKEAKKEAKKDEKKAVKDFKKGNRLARTDHHSPNASASNGGQFSNTENSYSTSPPESGDKGKAKLMLATNITQPSLGKGSALEGEIPSSRSLGKNVKSYAQRYPQDSNANSENEDPCKITENSEQQSESVLTKASETESNKDCPSASAPKIPSSILPHTTTRPADLLMNSDGNLEYIPAGDKRDRVAQVGDVREGAFSAMKESPGESSGRGLPACEKNNASKQQASACSSEPTENLYERAIPGDGSRPSHHDKKHCTHVNLLERSLEL